MQQIPGWVCASSKENVADDVQVSQTVSFIFIIRRQKLLDLQDCVTGRALN